MRVFNLCRSYRYQSLGYDVSLLAAARGHRPHPTVIAIQDLKAPEVAGILAEGLEVEIQRALTGLESRRFALSVYFGRNPAKRYDRLALRLFNLFEAPLLRARFAWDRDEGTWRVTGISPIAASEIPKAHLPNVLEAARDHFAGRNFVRPRRAAARDALAILRNPDERTPPSDPKALRRFERAARRHGFDVDLIGRDDYSRLGEYDALFIRETTAVNHHTYRFAQRAAAEGLVVIDDPESILRCSNKVYLAELLERRGVPTPKTRVLHRDNLDDVAGALGFPLILKRSDSSFSQGVLKVDDCRSFEEAAGEMLERSELVIAQEFRPTDFDWRIGVLEGCPLFACKYDMAYRHW